jgi:ubiquinone/menaquinone biosynthesis C-methylase UbiE
MQQVGTDFASVAEVQVYDERMGGFRDVDAENRGTLKTLALAKGATVLEIGCGTGRFARMAASQGLQVTAVDVSRAMLDYVRAKVEEDRLPEIKTQNAGFLTMDFPSGSFDAVVSGIALHHLPDAWKLVALRNIARVLKSNGQFLLRDIVYSLKGDDPTDAAFKRFLDGVCESMYKPCVGHIKKEFSTYDWIMEGLLTRAGFEILSTASEPAELLIYHCCKRTA